MFKVYTIEAWLLRSSGSWVSKYVPGNWDCSETYRPYGRKKVDIPTVCTLATNDLHNLLMSSQVAKCELDAKSLKHFGDIEKTHVLFSILKMVIACYSTCDVLQLCRDHCTTNPNRSLKMIIQLALLSPPIRGNLIPLCGSCVSV